MSKKKGSRLALIARIEDKVLRFWQGKPSRGGHAQVKCAKENGGIFDEKYAAAKSYGFREKPFKMVVT
jgi:hypothetical protein